MDVQHTYTHTCHHIAHGPILSNPLIYLPLTTHTRSLHSSKNTPQASISMSFLWRSKSPRYRSGWEGRSRDYEFSKKGREGERSGEEIVGASITPIDSTNALCIIPSIPVDLLLKIASPISSLSVFSSSSLIRPLLLQSPTSKFPRSMENNTYLWSRGYQE